MKKTVLTYGLIAGFIVCVWINVAIVVGMDHGTMSMVFGFAAMIAAFSFIFVAVKNYRDRNNGGIISFGKAFMIGLYISLIASTIYVITWLIDYHFFVPDFMDDYARHTLDAMKEAGKPATEIAETAKEMEQYKEYYKNPFMIALMTYTEILPVGLIISLLAAAILKRKPAEVATT
jgi:hypothetical protein